MAIVKKMTQVQLEKDSKHTDVDCTYSIVESDEGENTCRSVHMGQPAENFPTRKASRFGLAMSHSSVKRHN